MDCFNPRPPKRTLCPNRIWSQGVDCDVSIHVLRRGRCVHSLQFHLRPVIQFQSTSSEEDVVSPDLKIISSCSLVSIHVLRRGRCVCLGSLFQYSLIFVSIHVLRRGRCVLTEPKPMNPLPVSIHVLRRGRCV